jgi:hypothetical protein
MTKRRSGNRETRKPKQPSKVAIVPPATLFAKAPPGKK